MINFKENLEEITSVENEGDINLKNIDSNFIAKKGFKDILDSESCIISGEEKSKYSKIQTILTYNSNLPSVNQRQHKIERRNNKDE